MATQRKVEFQGTFNIQEILSAVDALQNRLNRIQLDDSSARRFERTFADLKKRAQEIDAEIKQGFTNTSQINNFNNHLQKLGQQMEILKGEIGRIDTSFSNLQLSPNLQKQFENLKNSANTMFDAYADQISSIESKISSFAGKTGVKFEDDEISGLAQAISSTEKLNQLQEEKRASLEQQRIAIQDNISSREKDLSLAEQEVQAARELRDSITEQLTAKRQKIAGMDSKNPAIEQERNERDILLRRNEQANNELLKQEKNQERINTALEKERDELTKIENSLSNITKFFNGLKGDSSGLDDDAAAAAKEFADLSNKVSQLEKQLEEANAELQKFKDLQSEAASKNISKSKKDFDNLGNSIKNASKETGKMGENLESLNKQDQFFDNLKNRATAVFGLTNAFIYMNRFIRQSVNAIKELDAAFTEIAVVTDMTTSQLWKSFDSYNEMAQQLGTTTVDAIKTSALYYQQGLETVEVMVLTEETMKMARIAGMDFAEATDRMTAALRGFKLEMSEASRVNDVFSALAAESAVDTDELSYALTKTASIAASAGMELETTSAFLSQMIETTREAPENIGTAMKTIIARFQELKTAVGDSVEIDGELVDVNKVDTALKSVGVQLRDSLTGQFRDLDDVFLELASKWDTLDRNTQRYVATIAAGSRQQSRFIAMMDNYERTLELVDIAQNSNGASAAQFAKTLDSVEAKMNLIKSSFEEFIGTVVGSDLVKNILDGVNSVLQMINDIADAGPVAIALFGTAFIMMIKKTISNFIASAKTVSSVFKTTWTSLSGDYSAKMKEANQQAVTDLENKIKNSLVDSILAKKIQAGMTAGMKTSPSGKSPEIITHQPGKNDKEYLINVKQRLQNNQTVSKEERQAIKTQFGIKQGGKKGDAGFVGNIDTYLATNFKEVGKAATGIKAKFSQLGDKIGKLNPLIGQTISSFANMGTMAIMGNAATKGTAALEGATVGNMVGSAVGTLGYLIPGAGPILGPIFQALGGTLGAFIGDGIGVALDNAHYGVGSEESIKKFEKQAQKIGEKTSKVLEKNKFLVESGDEYLELADNIDRTNEEEQKYLELQSQLVERYPELLSARNAESEGLAAINEQLREKIKLAKLENAEANAELSISTFQVDYSKQVRKSIKKRDELGKEFDSANNKWYDYVLGWTNSILSLGLADAGSALRAEMGLNDTQTDFGYTATISDLNNYGEFINNFFNDLNDNNLNPAKATYKDYLDFLSAESRSGYAVTEEQFEEFRNSFIETENEVSKIAQKFSFTYSELLNLQLQELEGTFAYENKDIVVNLINNLFPEEEVKDAIRRGEDLNAWMKEVLGEDYEQIVNSLNNLSIDDQNKFAEAFDSIGLFLKEDGNVSIEHIKNMFGENSEIYQNVFGKFSPEDLNKIGEKWEDVRTVYGDTIQKLANDYGLDSSIAFASITQQLQQESLAFAEAFEAEYLEVIDKIKKLPNAGEVLPEFYEQMQKTDVSSARDIAELSIKMQELGIDINTTNNLVASTGSIFSRNGLKASEAIEVINNELKSTEKYLEAVNALADNSATIEQINLIQETLSKLGKERIDISKIFYVSGQGFGIDSSALSGLAGKGIEGSQNILAHMGAQASLAVDETQEAINYLQNLADQGTATESQLKELSEKKDLLGEYTGARDYFALALMQQEGLIAEKAAKAQKQRIKDAREILLALERYYNLESQLLALDDKLENFELDLDISTNVQEKTAAFVGQLETLYQQQEAFKDIGKIYQRDLDDISKMIKEKYSEFFSIDQEGVLEINQSGWENFAKKVQNASDSESGALQLQKEELEKIQSEYEDIQDRLRENNKLQKEQTKKLEEYYNTLKEKVATTEEQIADTFIKSLEKELQAVKDNYEKIKDEDQKYLNSLQKNINKRRQLQQQQDQDKDIEKTQKRLGLLKRDTSGIYTKEIEELEAQLEQQLKEKTNTTIDNMLQEEQEKSQIVADELQLRETYLQESLEREKESRILTNQFVKEMMQKDSQEIIAYLLAQNEQYTTATETRQQLMKDEITKQVEESKAAQNTLYTNMDSVIVEADKKYDQLKATTIDEYLKWLADANKQELKVRVNSKDALDEIEKVKKAFYSLSAVEYQKEMDDLLVQIESASKAGKTEKVKELQDSYEMKLKQFTSMGGDEMIENTPGYKNKNGTISSYGAAHIAAELAGKNKSETNTPSYPVIDDKVKKGTEWESKDPNSYLKVWAYNENGEPYVYSSLWQARSGWGFNLKDLTAVSDENEDGLVRVHTTGEDFLNGVLLDNPPYAYLEASALKELYTKKYKTGGMVDYTGPAWVDGTPSKPEAFLSAADTANIAKLRDILSKVFESNSSSSNTAEQNQNTGDTYYEFHINVDELSDDYSAKDMMADMEKYIIQKSNYRNVINIGKRK